MERTGTGPSGAARAGSSRPERCETRTRVQEPERGEGFIDRRRASDERTADNVFVGREPELRALTESLDEAWGDRGHLVLLSGEPGIGKSRLVNEFALRARERGVRLVRGHCWEAGGAPPYWPWVQLLRSYLRGEDPDSSRARIGAAAVDIAQILPEVRDLFPDLAPPPTVDPDSARFQLFDSTASVLMGAASGDPLVLVLEDLHAGDTPSLLLLRFLANQISDTKLLVLGTYRDVELTPEHPLTSAVVELSREPSTRRIRLHGLTEEDSARFVAAAASVPIPRPLLVALHKGTNGNPLFLGEAVRLFVTEGRLGQLSDPAMLRIAVPRGIREVIGRRLEHLDDACQHAMSVASVLGTEFSTEALRRMLGTASEELLDILDRGAEAGLLEHVPVSLGRFRFSHELVRVAFYEDLTSANRMRLHQRAAEALRAIHSSDEEPHLGELAHHLFQAAPLGDAASAVEYARRAGEQAARSLAYEEAARLYQMAIQALELEEPVDQLSLGELLLARGDAQARAGDLPTARDTFVRAATNARRLGAANQLARASLGYGGRFLWARAGGDHQLVPMLQDALVLLGGSDDLLRVRLLSRLACALRSEPDRTLSATLSQQAVDLARQLDDRATLGYALTGRVWAIYWPENPEDRLQLSEEIIRVGQTSGDGERTFDGYSARCMTLIDLGAVGEARAALSVLERTAEELRQPAQWWVVRFFHTYFALLSGEFDRAEQLIALEVRPGQPAIPSHDDVSVHAMQMFHLRREQGRMSEVEEETRAAADLCPWYPVHRAALVCTLHELGRETEARAVFEDLAADGFGLLHRDSEWLLGIALTSEACAILGDGDRALTLYEQALPFERRHAHVIGEGSVGAMDRYLGLLAATMGRLEEAERHFQVAIEVNDRMGARPWTAHARYDLADLLVRRDRPGDRERAMQELMAVRTECGQLGMTALAEKVDRRIAGFGAGAIVGSRPAAAGPSIFRKEGEYWTVVFDSDAFRLKDTKGMRYLARLLAEPDREFHVLDLVGEGSAVSLRPADGEVLSRADALGAGGALLDPQAKAAYRRRLQELEEELKDARSMGDADRAERARTEREFIARELAAAVGLGGRDRMAVSASERARVSVTRAVKSAVARIKEHSSGLGDHLVATVRTGTYCSYTPDPRVPVSWKL
jgi:tetratricopeptide (TPR) repeat protein